MTECHVMCPLSYAGGGCDSMTIAVAVSSHCLTRDVCASGVQQLSDVISWCLAASKPVWVLLSGGVWTMCRPTLSSEAAPSVLIWIPLLCGPTTDPRASGPSGPLA